MVIFNTNRGVFRSVVLNCNTIIVKGRDGNDVIVMASRASETWQANFLGGNGDDTLVGAGGDDELIGGPGENSIFEAD